MKNALDEDFNGLSKREYFASKAMQAILTNAGRNGFDFSNVNAIALEATTHADVLIRYLKSIDQSNQEDL